MLNFFLLWLASTLGWFLLSSLVAVIRSDGHGPLHLKNACALGLLTSILVSTLPLIKI